MRRPWEKHKAEMVRLYIDESKKLDDVMKIMLDSFNFRASKRAYRFHFDNWGIEKYNCKKRNERKIRRQQHPPSPAMTTSLSQCSSASTGRNSRLSYGSETFDFSQQNQDYFHDSFAVHSVSQNTGLAFPDLTYPSALNDVPTQSMPTPSSFILGHRPPPTPEPEGVCQLEQMSPNSGLASLGPKSPFDSPLHSPLLDAIRRQDALQVRELIRCGMRLDVPDGRGSYPLHYAAALSDPRIARILLEAGADPNVLDRQGRTPLYLATTISSLKVLLEGEYPPNLHHRDNFGDTYLHSLLQAPSWHEDRFRREAVYCLLGNTRDAAATALNTLNSQGLSPFHMAIRSVRAGNGFTSALIDPLTRMLARNPNVTTPMPGSLLPLQILVEDICEAQTGSKDLMTAGEWDALQKLLLMFLDLSHPRMYHVRVLRAFLSPSLLFLSVYHLWSFLQRLVHQGIIDVSSPSEQGQTALLDILRVGYDAVALRGPVVEERVTVLVKKLISGMNQQALSMTDRQGRSAWNVYASEWADHRQHREILGMFAAKGLGVVGLVKREMSDGSPRGWGDEWGEELKVSRVVGWAGGGGGERNRMSCVMSWSDQGLLAASKATVKQEY